MLDYHCVLALRHQPFASFTGTAAWSRRDVEDILFMGVMGVVLGTPVVLALFARPKATWGGRRQRVALPLLFAIVVLTGVFAEKAINAGGNNGLLFGNPHQLLVQFYAVAATLVYSFVVTFVLLKFVNIITSVRADAKEEYTGLDLSQHHEGAYTMIE